jgi:hypothetical protein
MFYITNKTNKYYQFVNESSTQKPNSRIKNWKNSLLNKVYAFLEIIMLMPRIEKLSLKEYWSNYEFFETPIIHRVMLRDRFMVLLQMIHVNDINFESIDSLIKIKPIIDSCTNSIASLLSVQRIMYR